MIRKFLEYVFQSWSSNHNNIVQKYDVAAEGTVVLSTTEAIVPIMLGEG